VFPGFVHEPGRAITPDSSKQSTKFGLVIDMPLTSITRVQARLGKGHVDEELTSASLYSSLVSLGLGDYTTEDLDALLDKLRRIKRRSRHNTSNSPKSGRSQLMAVKDLLRFKTPFFRAEEYIPFTVQDFIECMSLAQPELHMSQVDCSMLLTIKEVLVSGDTNRLVAELAQVRIDDLAAPPPIKDLTARMEPIVGFVILLNTILIGVQTDPSTSEWSGWPMVEIGFTVFFMGELLIKIGFTSARSHFFGSDWAWNLFDALIVLLALFNLVVEFGLTMWVLDASTLTIARVIRLTRLTRLTRVIRWRFLKDLHLMIHGLMAGMKTLLGALGLLLLTVFVVAVLATMLIPNDDMSDCFAAEAATQLFDSVPRSMYTTFRCFLGDCNTRSGQPVALLLAELYGVPFIGAYCLIMVFVTFGVFNLIFSVYIESTLTRAKTIDQQDERHRYRESLRVARLAKSLLKTFVYAESRHRQVATDDAVGDCPRPLSKELFLLVIQDPNVQALMDELDLPPERASLFDLFDLNGNGRLDATELVLGFLKVRGEVRKSDIVATLCSVRSLQVSFARLEEKISVLLVTS